MARFPVDQLGDLTRRCCAGADEEAQAGTIGNGKPVSDTGGKDDDRCVGELYRLVGVALDDRVCLCQVLGTEGDQIQGAARQLAQPTSPGADRSAEQRCRRLPPMASRYPCSDLGP